jgi:hypothetical protein
LDVDQIGFCGTGSIDHALRARNLAAVWGTFSAAGAKVLVAVGPVVTRADALVYERAVAATKFTWCRLHASDRELTRRILSRGRRRELASTGRPPEGPTER